MQIRRLFPRNDADLRGELESIGYKLEDIEKIVKKRRIFLFKLESLPEQAISHLMNVTNSIGGEAAISENPCGNTSDAIVMIRRDRVDEFSRRLKSSISGLAVISERIEVLATENSDSNEGKVFQVGDRTYLRTTRPFIMGILNITPDSFYDGGCFFDENRAIEQAQKMVDEGADFIDVGGESTRPGAQEVTLDEEIRRVIPLIEKMAAKVKIPISIDTTKAEVARRALDAGARIVNDISALRWDRKMPEVVADSKATLIVLHMKGEPHTMQNKPHYDNLMSEIYKFLSERVCFALAAGIQPNRILVDPGIGFGKSVEDNFEIVGRLGEFKDLGPVLIGPSMKSFIGKTLNLSADEIQFGTAAAVATATMQGADVIRVHDVRDMLQVTQISNCCMTSTGRRDRLYPYELTD